MRPILVKSDVKKLFLYSINRSSGMKNRGVQSIILFSSWIGVMGLNFLGSILTTRILGPASYGDYKFVQTIWMLLTLISTIGFLQSGSRVVLLETEPPSVKQAIGVVLVIALIIGLLVGIVTVIIAYPIDYLFHTQVALITIILAPLVIGITLRDALRLILQSTNQITLLAGLEIFPSLIYVFGLYTITKVASINILITLVIQQASLLGTVLVIIFILRPHIGSFRHYLQKIKEENRKFGFPTYLGLVATFATSYINRLSISYWVDNTAIGFFSLAATITEPFRFIPNSAAISSFKSFANQEKIPRKILWFTIIMSFLALVAALILIDPLLALFYSKEFSSVGPMAKILSIGAIAQGFGEFYNRFLGAHGKGKELRNTAYFVGMVYILGSIFLTPFLGINGALITAIIAGFAYVTFMFLTYRKIFH